MPGQPLQLYHQTKGYQRQVSFPEAMDSHFTDDDRQQKVDKSDKIWKPHLNKLSTVKFKRRVKLCW